MIYLGGLGDQDSEHLRSRIEVAELLAARVPGLVHVRAAMVIGSGSASFVMLRSLVARLPVMVCPRWIDTRTQPIAVARRRRRARGRRRGGRRRRPRSSSVAPTC